MKNIPKALQPKPNGGINRETQGGEWWQEQQHMHAVVNDTWRMLEGSAAKGKE